MREITCCLIGKNTYNTKCEFDEKSFVGIEMKSRLMKIIQQAIDSGYTNFILGVASESEVWAAESILERKTVYPQIKLEAVITCMSHAKHLGLKYEERFIQLVAECDHVNIISLIDTQDNLLLRNEYMIDNASLLIVVCHDNQRGIDYTIDYAHKKELTIKCIGPSKESGVGDNFFESYGQIHPNMIK